MNGRVRYSAEIDPRYAICMKNLNYSCKPNRQAVEVRRTRESGANSKTISRERIAMIRYGFNIKTRSGQRVDNICIMASSREEAERRLRQMYHHCEIVACHSEAVRRSDPLDLEAVIGIISNDPVTIPAVARSMLRNKPIAH
jgi:hypothetical protein